MTDPEKIAELVEANMFVDPSPEATTEAWYIMLQACQAGISIGFGMLDSFLDGPDLNRRIALVRDEAPRNQWLRAELKDALSLDQSKNLSPDQIVVLEKLIAHG